MKIAQESCLHEESSGSLSWSASPQMLIFFLLWFCFCGLLKKTQPNPQLLRTKEPLVFRGSPYMDASDEGV